MSGNAFGIAGAGADLASAIRQTAKTILIAANTLARNNVETSRNDELTEDDPFVVCIYTPRISRAWRGDSPPSFVAKVYLSLICKVSDPMLGTAEILADTLRIQVEQALLGAPAFFAPASPVERINSIETTMDFPNKGRIVEGIVTMQFELQCTDVFAPIIGVPLQTINLTVPDLTTPAGSAGTQDETPADNLIGATIIMPQGA